MEKHENLVKQIRQMLERVADGETIEFDEDDIVVLGARIATAITDNFRGRKPRKRTEKVIYFSELGSPCHRKVWYKYNGVEGEKLQPSALIKFMYGNILEEVVLFLAEQAGAEVTERQGERELEIGNGWKVRGRLDAVINGQLMDVKSASTPSFTKIMGGKLTEDDPFGYISQLYGYHVATDDDHESKALPPGFLVIDKTLGSIGAATYEADMDLDAVFKNVIDKGIDLAHDLEKEDPPPPAFDPVPDGKSGNMKLPINCSYCPFKHECWKHTNGGKGLRTFFYSNGPRFLTDVKKDPNVPEQK